MVTWQWQLSTPLDTSVEADIYDVDAVTTTARQVAELHAKGRKVICYVNVGAVEDFRHDRHRFPEEVVGRSNGWPGERWLDIRRLDILVPIISERFDLCRDKGFDGVEPDNVDGYANETGFPLTASDQLDFNRAVARLAHERRLAVALKNDAEQAAELEPHFDFALVEQCFQHQECDAYAPFQRAGKTILDVEYDLEPDEFCAQAAQQGVSAIAKPIELTAERTSC